MLETVALNLLAGGLARSAESGVEKVREILRRERFAEDIDDLATEFNTALKQAFDDALTQVERDELGNLDTDWTIVARELDNLNVVFETEKEAIVRITDAIGESLEIDLEAHPAVQESLEAAVADAYQTALRGFADRVAGTELADVLTTETNIELTTTVNSLDDQLTAIQRQLRREETAALRNVGVIRLDPLYFERTSDPVAPDTAWRSGFGFPEIAAGYPLDRERQGSFEDQTRRSVTDEILEQLDNGTDLVVLGEGGSGKSTVCKQVAYQWHTNSARGPVFYRSSSATAPLDEPGALLAAIRAVDGPVLVAVEDAAHDAVRGIYEVLAEFEGSQDVSFLLDSRKKVWRESVDEFGNARLARYQNRLETIEMPALDERECERALTHYESLIDEEIGLSSDQLYDEVRAADIGGPLLLAYRLTGPLGGGAGDVGTSALRADVNDAYLSIAEWANGDELPLTVALIANVVNAAELPVREPLFHALATDRDDHRTIEETLAFLDGLILESSSDGLQMPHQVWSSLYLEQALETDGERLARDHFERCVSALFELVDTEAKRTKVRNWMRIETGVLAAYGESPSAAADRIVRSISSIGTDRPIIGQFHGSVETFRVDLPDVCSPDAEREWFAQWGSVHKKRGALDAAQSAFERIIDRCDSVENPTQQDQQWRARGLGKLSGVHQGRGDLAKAEECIEESLAISEEIGDTLGKAKSLRVLGDIARNRRDADDAEEYFQRSLAIAHDINDRREQARNLNSLGILAMNRSDYDKFSEYSEEALEIYREIGDRSGQASVLGNLGIVAKRRAEFDTAEEYLRQSLRFSRDIGDLSKQATSLFNLGTLSTERGNLDAANEYYEDCLQLRREIGNYSGQAMCLKKLGQNTMERGDLNRAKEYFEESLSVLEDIDHPFEEGTTITRLGMLARKQGNFDAAKEYHEDALSIFETIDYQAGIATCFIHLGELAHHRGEHETASEYYDEAIELAFEIGEVSRTLQGFEGIVDGCERQGVLEDAVSWCDRAIEYAERNDEDEAVKKFQKRRTELSRE